MADGIEEGNTAIGPQGRALVVRDLHIAIGKRDVVRRVTFEIGPGEVLAVLGRNGSGKSTLLRGIAGLRGVRSGSIMLGTDDLTELPTHERVACGMRTLLQERETFKSLTVFENLLLSGCSLRDTHQHPERGRESFLDLPARRWASPCGDLSGGEKRLLGLDMVLARDPACLLLDEPTAGIAPPVADRVLARIAAEARRTVIPILLIEQKISAALAIADRVLILSQGTGTEHSAAEVRRDPRRFLLGVSPAPTH
jgi:branched-chain amino acid transport system ATP-binding protein